MLYFEQKVKSVTAIAAPVLVTNVSFMLFDVTGRETGAIQIISINTNPLMFLIIMPLVLNDGKYF